MHLILTKISLGIHLSTDVLKLCLFPVFLLVYCDLWRAKHFSENQTLLKNKSSFVSMILTKTSQLYPFIA